MASINLLPWREAARKQQQLNYLAVLAQVAVLAFVLMFFVYWLYQARVEGQISRNALLETEIKLLDKRIAQIRELEKQKAGLQQRMSLISQLQGSRNLGTQIMDEIASAVPAGVYLTHLEKKGTSLLLIGLNSCITFIGDAVCDTSLCDSAITTFFQLLSSKPGSFQPCCSNVAS